MSRQVRLIADEHGTIRRGRCAICGLPYESVGCGHLFRDGRLIRGYVCLRCLKGWPLLAADRLRWRAARVRRLLEHCHVCLWSWGWTGLHRLLLEHAADLDGLANCLPAAIGRGRNRLS